MKKYLIVLMSFVWVLPAIQAQEESEETAFGRNNISLFLSDVAFKRATLEYEHVFGEEGNLSLNIPASVSFGKFTDVYNEEVDWWVGLGMKLYPTGQGKIRYFFGPEVRVISASYHNEYYEVIYHDGWAENVHYEEHEDYIHTAFLFNNGMIYEPTENFIFSVSMGVGFIAKDEKADEQFLPMATPSVRMGIRF